MTSSALKPTPFSAIRPLGAALVAGLAAFAAESPAQQRPAPSTPAPATRKAATWQTFSSAQLAADAFISAAERFDVPALQALLGPGSDDLILTGEPVKDRETATAFAAQARVKVALVTDPKTPGRTTVVVGPEDWPLPIPIVEKGGRWHFDAKAGRRELLHRRIGQNELDAIEICRGFVEAQHEYALMKHEGSSTSQYAQRIISTPGRQDGLAWRNADGTWAGPIGENIARAIEHGYTSRAEPYHGYYFKVLKGQGPAAPMGKLDFVVKGVMIGGFALAAAPSEYGVTGVKTFIVSHDGVVYEKDLGRETARTFKAMERYNPDKTWTPLPGE